MIRARSQLTLLALALCAIACQPRLRSDSAETVPSDRVWNFSSASDAALSSSTFLEISSGLARLAPIDQTDSDDLSTGFGGGTKVGLDWDSTRSILRLQTASGCNGATQNCSDLTTKGWLPRGGTGLVTLHSLDNNYLDSSGNGFNLSALTSSDFTTSARVGTHAAQRTAGFAGIASTSAFTEAFASNRLTVSAWIYRTANSDYSRVVHVGDPNPSADFAIQSGGPGFSDRYALNLVGTDTLTCYGNRTSVIPLNRWVHFVGTYDGSNIKAYINGVQDGANSACTKTVRRLTNKLTLLAAPDYGNAFTGRVDHVSLWNVALTAAEVSQLYESTRAQYSGGFVSRVMDVGAWGAGAATWTQLSQSLKHPALKELPSGGSSEAITGTDAYTGLPNATLMSGLEYYFRFQESTYTGAANEVVNSSGIAGRNGQLLWGGGGPGVTIVDERSGGLFSRSARFNGTDSYLNITKDNAAMRSNITVSAWFKDAAPLFTATEACIVSSRGSFILGPASWGDGTEVQFGVRTSVSYRTVSLQLSNLGLLTNEWHHYLGTYDDTTKTTLLYIDGQQAATLTHADPSGLDVPLSLLIGADDATSDGTPDSYCKGDIDEVALWSRALTPDEVLSVYRRGANRVRYQVRTCTAADCSDQDSAAGRGFKGPGGTADFSLSEVYSQGALGQLTQTFASLSTLWTSGTAAFTPTLNRYFQYRAQLESDHIYSAGSGCDYGSGAGSCSPEVQSVSVGPVHYNGNGPYLTLTGSQAYRVVSQLTRTLGSNGCSSGETYALSADGVTWYYYNGTQWVASNSTTAQSGTIAQTQAGLSAFATTVGSGNLQVRIFLNSTGLSACEIDQVSLTVGI